jgi:hypothetical protein
MGDAIYFLPGAERRVYKGTDPVNNEWTVVTSSFAYTLPDPDLFVDDDGRLYYYGGSSDHTPIVGRELNPSTFAVIGSEVNLISGNQAAHGWERMQDYNTDGNTAPWIEGSFMQKYKGRYYLEYATPGTQYKGYNDAVYVADNPLGPFTLAKHNPMSYLPEGFIAAAGHGSSTLDKYGNWWHIATSAIAVRHYFERRLGLYPTFFDADGEMYAYTGFGDWPLIIPDRKVSSPDELKPGWYLLSYNKPTYTSSTQGQHLPINAVNENVRVLWAARSGKAGEFFTVNLTRHSTINAIQINFGDEGATQLGRVADLYYQYHIDVSSDNVTWKTVVDRSTNTADLPHEYHQLDPPVEGLLVRIVNVHTPDPMLFSLFGFRIFGKQDRVPPPAPAGLTANRLTDTRSVALSWQAVPTAVGYNIRFGLDAKKLYHNYIAYDRTTLQINSLLAKHDYWFTIDAFNEGGITLGTTVVGPRAANTAPVLTRVSSPSWGSFPAAGPSADQVIQFSLVDPDPGDSWKLSWRFDAEAFRQAAAVIAVGTNSYTFPKTLFTGSRITAGAHTASILVTDNAGVNSNIITVSYTVAAAAKNLE